MKQTLIFTTGETTCYDSETRTMCRFMRSSSFEQKRYCTLFGDTFDDVDFLQRTYECKEEFGLE